MNGPQGIGGVSDTNISQMSVKKVQLVENRARRAGTAAADAVTLVAMLGSAQKTMIQPAVDALDGMIAWSTPIEATQSIVGRSWIRRRLMQMRRMLHTII